MAPLEPPPDFLCPISLKLMKDPVIISTGISYDRYNIHMWLNNYNHNTCPVTNQQLTDNSLTPNSNLLRLIHSWTQHPLTITSSTQPATITTLLRDLTDPNSQLSSLKSLKELLQDDANNILPIDKVLALPRIVSIITFPDQLADRSEVIDEAATVLYMLNPSPHFLKDSKNGELIVSLSLLLQRGTYRSRIHATLILKSIFKVVNYGCKTGLPPQLFDGLLELLKDQNSSRAATLASLSIMIEVLPYGTNRTKAVEAGVVPVIVELLMEDGGDQRSCEGMLCVLELVCEREEGRSALLAHSAGVAAVVGKILKVSSTVTERSVMVLLLLCRFCHSCGIGEEMMMVGGAAKICMVVQVECCKKTKERAREILRMHLKGWSKFPCFPSHCFP